MMKKLILIALGVIILLLIALYFLNNSFNTDLPLEETINTADIVNNISNEIVNDKTSYNQKEENLENQVVQPSEEKEETTTKKDDSTTKKNTTTSTKKNPSTTTTKKDNSSTSTTTKTETTKPSNNTNTSASKNETNTTTTKEPTTNTNTNITTNETTTNDKANNNETTKTENVTTTTNQSTSSNTSETNPKEEVKQEEPKQEEPKQEEPKQEEKPVIKDEYVRNDAMIEKIKSTILNNQSQTMTDYGFEVVVDSSIVKDTNYFTFTEKRVIAKILYKFGKIKIYAQDQYYNGEYIQTQCFIL